MSIREKATIMSELRSAADDVMDAEFTLSEKRRARDELMREARTVRVSFRDIADACLVSHQTVANIVAVEATRAATTTAPPESQAGE
jgi:anti-sigma factor RsiW